MLGLGTKAFILGNDLLRGFDLIQIIKPFIDETWNTYHKTDKTLTTVKAILKDLRITKQRGYSLNNEELVPGLIAIGAPIINLHNNRVLGSVRFDFSAAQHSASVIERRYSETIICLGNEISKASPG
jgi:IclR family pca regulon transcriptional regulator